MMRMGSALALQMPFTQKHLTGSLKVASKLLGHRSVATTADICAHVLPETLQEVVKKMDDLYGRS